MSIKINYFFYREINLKINTNGYLILCINYKKGYIGKFEISFFSDKKLQKIDTFQNYFQKKHNKIVESNFDIKNCGDLNVYELYNKNIWYYSNKNNFNYLAMSLLFFKMNSYFFKFLAMKKIN